MKLWPFCPGGDELKLLIRECRSVSDFTGASSPRNICPRFKAHHQGTSHQINTLILTPMWLNVIYHKLCTVDSWYIAVEYKSILHTIWTAESSLENRFREISKLHYTKHYGITSLKCICIDRTLVRYLCTKYHNFVIHQFCLDAVA